MTPVKPAPGVRPERTAAASWDVIRIVKLAIAALAVIWLLSQLGTSPLDRALSAVGTEHPSPDDDGGLSPEEYNRQHWWNDELDEWNGCPPLSDCAGFDPYPFAP